MQDFEKAFSEIQALLPEECISLDREDLISHGSSSWTYHDPKVLPGAVLFPRNTDDVRKNKLECIIVGLFVFTGRSYSQGTTIISLGKLHQS